MRANATGVGRNVRCGLSTTCEDSLTPSLASAVPWCRLAPERTSLAVGAAAALLCALLAPCWRSRRRPARPTPRRSKRSWSRPRRSRLDRRRACAQSQERLAVAEGEAATAAARRGAPFSAAGRRPGARRRAEPQADRHPRAAGRREGAAAPLPRTPWRSGWWRSTKAASPSTAPASIFGSGDYEELATRADYLRAIEESDSALADRVEQVRDEVRREAELVAELEARAVAYNERLAAARCGNRRCARSRPGSRRPPANRSAPNAKPRWPTSNRHRQLGGRARSGRSARPAVPKPKKKSAAGSAAPTRSPPTSSCASPAATTAPSTPLPAPVAPTRSSLRPGTSTAAKGRRRSLQGGTGPHRRRNLGRLRRRRLGLRMSK